MLYIHFTYLLTSNNEEIRTSMQAERQNQIMSDHLLRMPTNENRLKTCIAWYHCPVIWTSHLELAEGSTGILYLVHTYSTARGFEPLRAEPNGFRVHHLSHSVTLSTMGDDLDDRQSQRMPNHLLCMRANENMLNSCFAPYPTFPMLWNSNLELGRNSTCMLY